MLTSTGLFAMAGALLAAALAVAGAWRRSARRRAHDAARRSALDRETAALHRMATRLHEEHQFVVHFLKQFPHLSRELGGQSERRIPATLLNIVQRILRPKQAVVLVRRRAATLDATRPERLVVAAVAPEVGTLKVGVEIAVGEGDIGFAAEVQRSFSRSQLDNQPAPTRARLKESALPGFVPDLVVPMIFGEETMGVLATAGVEQNPADAKAVLRVIAQVGSMAIHDRAAYEEMKVTADVDGLTLVYNKRHLTRVLAEEILNAQLQMQTLGVFLFDIDNFKNYNDQNGHLAGDQLLKELARLVKDSTRKENIVGRFGGEEFMIVYRGETAERALVAAEYIRKLVAEHPFPFADRQPLGLVSVSGGVAEYPRDGLDSAALVHAADGALYEAKRGGRNCVRAARPRQLGEEGPRKPPNPKGERDGE